MTRLHFFMVLFAFIALLWLGPLLWPLTVIFFEHHPITYYIWSLLPLWLIILFGLYSIIQVLYDVFNVKDYPEAHKQLLNDIDQARKSLTKKGFDWN